MRCLVAALIAVWTFIAVQAPHGGDGGSGASSGVVSGCGGGAVCAQGFVTSTPTPSFTVTMPSPCPAPCQVFVDATGSTDASTPYPFHENDYAWDGGGITGNWAYGSNTSKNKAYGPLAGFVYDTPGPYTVTLTVTGLLGSKSTTHSFTVDDPATVFSTTKTTCVASGSLPVQGVGGCPSNAAVAQQADWPTIISSYLLTGQRVLLKCTDTFTTTSLTNTINVAGAWSVGAYGSGCLSTGPVLQYSGSSSSPGVLISLGTSASNGRFSGLGFDGQGHQISIASFANNAGAQILFENLSAVGTVYGGISYSGFSGAATAPIDQIFVVGTTITNMTVISTDCGPALFLNGVKHSAFIGNNWGGMAGCTTASNYVARVQSWNKLYFGNGNYDNPPPGKNALDIHGPTSSASSDVSPSQYAVLTDNRTSSPDASMGVSSANLFINPQSISVAEDIRDVRVIRPLIVTGLSTNFGMRIEAINVSVENPIIEMGRTGAVQCHGININWDSSGQGQPKPYNIWIRGGTLNGQSCTATGSDFVNFTTSVGYTEGKNLLMYVPNSASSSISGGSSSLTVAAGNTSGLNFTANPFATTPNPATPSTYAPDETKYAKAGNGVTVPVYFDFFRASTLKPIGAIN